MARVVPLQALRVASGSARSVAAVPYDVVDRAAALALAADSPRSFLHVTRPDIDWPEGTPASTVYAGACRALAYLEAEAALVRETRPCYYAYGLTEGSHRQVGVVFGASVADYTQGVIRRHELTRAAKEQERVDHMMAVRAQTGKVFLLHRPQVALAELLEACTASPAAIDFVADDGVRHQLWVIDAPAQQAQITAAFATAEYLYIADGHHRAAAAVQVAAHRRGHGGLVAAETPFLAVSFSSDAVRILPYFRLVRDLGGRSPAAFVQALGTSFAVARGLQELAPGRIGVFVGGAWFTLTAREATLAGAADAMSRLDVSLVQNHILAPLLGIDDPRRDARLDFVGGHASLRDLENLAGAGAAFALHPTSVNSLLRIADAGGLMPPKSTWFSPKLRDGLVSLPLAAEGAGEAGA